MSSSNLNVNFVISSIEGNIACGKSTILDYISSKCNAHTNSTSSSNKHVECLQEPVAEWMNMSSGTDLLKLFYEESEKWCFSFENLVQLSRLKSLYESTNHLESKAPTKPSDSMRIVLERSIFSSYNVFAKNSLEENRLNRVEFDILSKYYSFFTRNISISNQENVRMNNVSSTMIPYQIIYIRTSPEVCLHRLRKRNRESENRIDLEYLTRIHLKYEQWIQSLIREKHSFVKIIDGNKDKQSVLQQIDSIFN